MAGVAPHTWIMENEASLELKADLKGECVKYQLVSSHNHCTNLAGKAICTFKNHFVAGLESVDLHLSVRKWDRLIPQEVHRALADMTSHM